MSTSTAITLTVDRTRDGAAISTVVREATGLAWTAAKSLCTRGKVRVDDVVVTDPGARVRKGSAVVIDPKARSTGVAAAAGVGGEHAMYLDRARLLHLDGHIAVFDKPPGINTVPYEEGERGALVDRLAVALHRWGLAPVNAPLFVVHRLDRETSGVLVFGRNWVAKRHLAGLFRRHDIERTYIALVQGRFTGERTIESVFVDNRGDGLRGSARGKVPAGSGRPAVTHVKSLAVLPCEGGATLVECRLETGRQHQIRIHLSEAGHPVVGDRVYVRGYEWPLLPAARVMLHARTLGFTHPARPEAAVERFESELPGDFVETAKRLGWSGNF